MREFTTAVAEKQKAPEEQEKGYPFKVDGVALRCYKPNEAQLAIFLASTGRHSSDSQQIAGVINFFASILDRASYNYIENRLLDREDDFGLKEVQDIIEWMIEEWTGNPTQSPSVSTGTPQSSGDSSTEGTPALTF